MGELVISLNLMRFHFVIICAVLLVGCQSAHESRDAAARIAESLERQITAEEAQRIVVSHINPAIRAAQARSAAHEDSRVELEILTRHRQRSISELESFLSRRQSGDELWTYLTAGPPCRESGLALVRGGQVVEHMAILIE